MPQPAERPRTALRLPRVEFDLSALLLGAVGWLAYQWTWPALAWLLQVETLREKVPGWAVLKGEFFGRLFLSLRLPYTGYLNELVGASYPFVLAPATEGAKAEVLPPAVPEWKLVVVGAWLLVLWSVVGGALARVFAVRFARDESVGAGDAVAFSVGEVRSFVLAPLFVAGAAALFVAAAAAAGAASALPWAGPVLQVVLHPLALVAGLLLVVVAAGGIFGFPIMQAALATERNGTLDAISRTYSYVFARPSAFIVPAAWVVVVTVVLQQFGGAFLHATERAFSLGAAWNDDSAGPLALGFRAAREGGLLAVPSVGDGGWMRGAWIVVTWLWTSLAVIAVNGWILAYFVGGLTDTYVLLRKDVDGIDEGEVWVEGEPPGLGEPLPGQPAPPPAAEA